MRRYRPATYAPIVSGRDAVRDTAIIEYTAQAIEDGIRTYRGEAERRGVMLQPHFAGMIARARK